MNCHLCGGADLAVIRTKLRFGITRNVLRCQTCSLIFLEPRGADLKNYYDAEYRKKYSPTPGATLTSEEIFNVYFPFQKERLSPLLPFLRPDMRVLDIGSSAGHLLHALKPFVGERVGIEFNRDDASFARSLGITVYTEQIEKTDLAPATFDLITVFQTFEHVDAPVQFLASLGRYLKKDGYLAVEVPNLDDALLSVYEVEKFADFWFIEPHLYYFNANTLEKILKKAGFVGTVKSTQEYSLVNHLNWALAGKPQDSAEIGMRTPALATGKAAEAPAGRALNEWLKKTDNEYRRLLEKLGVGGKLLFIGKKI